jgi:adenine/guanine phosphoribosyltransferase-like PRPP-binding protein
MVRVLSGNYLRALGPGSVATEHNLADDRGFVPARDVRGQAFLLIDDTFTSGARIQSAASALALAGGDVVAALVVGRVINPERSPASRELWERVKGIPFSFDQCCLEAAAALPAP